MHSFLKTNPLLALILLFSPVALAVPFLIFGGDYLTVLYGTVFLGSFHIILTPLFQRLLSATHPEITALNKRINLISLIIFIIGLALALLSNHHTTLFLEPTRTTLYALVIFSVAFHSAQQEFGILLALQSVPHFSFIKIAYRIIPILIAVNYYFMASDTLIYQPAFFMALLTLALAILSIILKQANLISFLFALRILLWPTSIYIPHLTPLVFAMHGIEYLIFYFYLNSQINPKKMSHAVVTLNFILTMILTVATYSLGHYFKYLSFTFYSEALLSVHFALQFRHYWLDRQIFRLSKPISQLSKLGSFNSGKYIKKPAR